MSNRLWRIAVTVPDEQSADAVAGLIDSVVLAVTAFEQKPKGKWLVQGFAESKPESAAIEAGLTMASIALGIDMPELIVEQLDDTDWLRRNQESFPPMRIGRYFVHGSHITEGMPGGAISLRIDAATAFGTGEHATTNGCLLALNRLVKNGKRRDILDMGTGTGILAIAAAKSWGVPVLACDIDPHSVDVAKENVALNGVSKLVTCIASNGYAANNVRARAKYDLIFANILARPLARMAPSLARHLAPGGVAILSGLLANQEAYVRAAHRVQGLHFVSRIPINGWHTLVFAQK